MGSIPASDNVFDHVQIAEAAAPSTPASGRAILYVKSDGMVYWKDDGGTEHAVGTGDATAHIADTTDAHDASAISIVDAGTFYTGTDVEAALQELGTAVGGGVSALDDLSDVATAGAATDDVLTYNGSSWAPAAPTGGGGGSDPVADAFGTPDTAYEFDTGSMPGGLTVIGTPDVESADGTVAGHLLIADDDSTQVGRYAAVSTPFTMITKITDFVAYENYQYVGAFCGVGTPGYMEGVYLLGGASPSLVGRSFATPGTGSPGAISFTRMPTDPVGYTPWYIGIRVASSTDVSYYVSRSGVVWVPLLLNRNPSQTIASCGVSVGNYAGGSQPRAAGCYDYIRIWNSAKTFPAFS